MPPLLLPDPASPKPNAPASQEGAPSCLAPARVPQVNVWVGPFFVLSGYVAGYTATELGKYEASARVKPAGAYTVARVAGFYPLFALIQVGAGAGRWWQSVIYGCRGGAGLWHWKAVA